MSNRRRLYKNLAIIVSRCVPGFIINWKNEIEKVNDICKSRPYNDYKYVGNLLGNWHEKEIAKREWFGIPKLYEFENLKVYGVEKPDEYLTSLYGDWRKLPPKENQKTHHDYLFIDLNKSYLK